MCSQHHCYLSLTHVHMYLRQWVDLSRGNLVQLPPKLALPRLQIFDMSFNLLTQLPDLTGKIDLFRLLCCVVVPNSASSECRLLSQLGFTGNQVTAWPAGLESLVDLTELYASYNPVNALFCVPRRTKTWDLSAV